VTGEAVDILGIVDGFGIVVLAILGTAGGGLVVVGCCPRL
jgi:hypothetical protein